VAGKAKAPFSRWPPRADRVIFRAVMTWEIAVVLMLVAFALVQFLRERWPTDLTGLTVFAALLVLSQLPFATSFPDARELLSVFANPAPLTVAAMFILSNALERTGALTRVLGRLENVGNLGPRGLLLAMMLGTAVVSAFINNTPVVVVGLPIAIHLANRAGVSASIFLIPLSYASIFGGTCTLVGTSTNILASGLLADTNHAPFGMFETAAVGLPLLVLGTAYVVLMAPRLLPERKTLAQDLSEGGFSEYVVEASVEDGSLAVGKTLAEADLGPRAGLRVLEVLRRGEPYFEPLDTLRLRGGDRIVVAGPPEAVAAVIAMPGVRLDAEKDLAESGEGVVTHEGRLAEAIVGPLSEVIGRSVRELNFRQRFGVVVLAIHRRGTNLSRGFESIPLQPGDTLLLLGPGGAVKALRANADLLLLDRPRVPTTAQRARTPVVLATLAGVIAAATFNLVPIAVAALVGCVFLMITGTLKPRQAYRSVDWSLLFLIYSTLALGLAMQQTGAAEYIAGNFAAWATEVAPVDWKPFILLAVVFVLTVAVTELLSNNATVVLMMPIALGAATELGLDPRPFAIATTIAASACFSTPIGYQTNTYVYSAGGYRFTDFTKFGLPLNLLYFVGAMIIIPLVWPFHK
jgi:di/tricarboxylate transporter